MRRKTLLGAVLFCTATLFYPDSVSGQAADFGLNLEGNVYWDTSEAWNNVASTLSGWGEYATPWINDPSLTFTTDGYPLESAGAITELDDYPDGIYQVSYTGDATLAVAGMGTLSDMVTTGNTTTAELTVNHSSGALLAIQFSNINPTDPEDNLQVLVPGAGPGLFTTTFINRLAPASTIRFMGWEETNGNPVVNWSDRTTPQNVIQTSGNGVALEDQIALANEANKNGWFNIPVGATDDYVKNMADLLYSTMAPDHTIYIEYSNELWNYIYSQWATNYANAQANPLLTPGDSIQLTGEQDAYRTMQISQIFQQEFGSSFASRVKVVLAGQGAWTYFTSSGLSYLQANFGNPSNYISDVAIAPYIGITDAQNTTGLTLDGLFDDLFANLAAVTQDIQQYKSLASQYNLSLVAYEGGQALTSWNSTAGTYVNQDLMEQAQSDPRMGVLLTDLLNDWTSSGGQLYNYLDFVGTDSTGGFWGLLQDINQQGSVKWDAVLRTVLPLGDVNGDGVVNAEDMEIIISNMGQSGMWYQQGDLNGDGVVNADDLALFFLGSEQASYSVTFVPEPSAGMAILGGRMLLEKVPSAACSLNFR